VRTTFILLLGLIGISPILPIVGGPMIYAFLVAYAAVAVTLVEASIQPGEAGHLASLIRPIAMIAPILAVWMLAQTIPLPIKSWAHPIWASAETALDNPIAGSITIDPGATLVAICRYLSVIAIFFVATAVAIDRTRAEWILFWLVGVTTLAAMAQIIYNLAGLNFPDEATDAGIRASTTALCALGVVVAATATIRAIERYETRRTRTDVPSTKFAIALSLALVAFAICSLSLALFAPAPIIFAAANGFAILAIIMIIRRLGLNLWTGVAIAAIAIGSAIAIAETHVGSGILTLRYASHSQSSLISMAQRIIEDTGWFGTGAGTFASLLPIYQAADNVSIGMSAPTTAAQVAIELGWPAFWAILMMTIGFLFLLLRGALQRGRDSFYPAAGAGCIVVLTLEAFCDASLFRTTVVICAAAALGLGLAQSVSRTSQ
jgi:hypothetical protein